MKKIALLIASVLIALSASADFRWGPTAGVNVSNYHMSQDLIQTDKLVGGSAGVMTEVMFPGIGFGMDLGLIYEMHGSRLHFDEREIWASDGIGTTNSYLHTLQIPIDLRFKYTRLNGLESKIAPFVYGGPVFTFLVGHNNVEPLEYSHGYLGLQCGIGAELLERFQVSAGYYWDISYEVKTTKLSNFTGKAQGWQLKFTYLLK